MEVSEMAKALGQKGGQTTAKKYGAEHFKRMQALSLKARKAKKTS